MSDSSKLRISLRKSKYKGIVVKVKYNIKVLNVHKHAVIDMRKKGVSRAVRVMESNFLQDLML